MRNMNTLELLDLLSEALESEDIKKEIEKLRDSIVFAEPELLPKIDLSEEGYLNTRKLAIKSLEANPNLTSSIVAVDAIKRMMKRYFNSSALGLAEERISDDTLHVTVSLQLGDTLIKGAIAFLSDVKQLYNSKMEEL